MTRPWGNVYPTLDDAAAALADCVARALRDAAGERGIAAVALSGGSTPRPLYETLAREHGRLPWPQIHVLWGDERYVPHDSPDSNYRMARGALLDGVPIPPGNVHPMPTHLADPEEAAARYAATLAELLPGDPPRIDVTLLGLGADGHTASLFPGSATLAVRDRLVATSEAPDEPRQRLTLTLPALNASRQVHFLAGGAGKREALRCALDGDDPEQCPAALVAPGDGTVTWWLDEAVAGDIAQEG